MTLVAVDEWKEIECDDCGRVSSVVKWIPIKQACCGSCGSLKIRLYISPEERTKRSKAKAGKSLASQGEGE